MEKFIKMRIKQLLLKNSQVLIISLVIMCALIFQSCLNRQKDDRITIGITYQNLQNEFIINIQDAIRDYADENNLRIIEVDGQGKAENQISQTENFLALDVDAIILNPIGKYGSAPVVSIANREHKPIVVINAIVVNMDKATSFVGSNDSEAGRIAAKYICKLLENEGNIAIIKGLNGHSAEIQRTAGIYEVLKQFPKMKVVYEQTANWDRAQGLNLMENWLSSGKEIDAVIAQNDEMALGAYNAIEAAGRQNDILVIGIDAIQDALRSVKEGKLCGTVFQDAKEQGRLSMEVAMKAVKGEQVDKKYYIPFQLVTKENLSEFLE